MDRDTYKARLALFPEALKERLPQQATDAARFERLVQQAEVAMDRLTGSAEWDGFVQIVQSRLEAAKDDYEHEAYALAHPSFRVSIEAMTRARIGLAERHGVLDTLEWIVGLPREIMDAAEDAGLDDETPA